MHGPNCIKIAILTSIGEYLEFQVIITVEEITSWIASKLKSLFNDFVLVSESEVLLSDRLKPTDAICLYLQIVRHHVNFLLTTKDNNSIIKRIRTYHKLPLNGIDDNVWRRYLQKTWRWLVDRRKCPWINAAVGYSLEQKTKPVARDIMMLRISMYYMFVRKKYRDIHNRCIAKKTTAELA